MTLTGSTGQATTLPFQAEEAEQAGDAVDDEGPQPLAGERVTAASLLANDSLALSFVQMFAARIGQPTIRLRIFPGP
jgi:hypothetical protein